MSRISFNEAVDYIKWLKGHIGPSDSEAVERLVMLLDSAWTKGFNDGKLDNQLSRIFRRDKPSDS